MLCTYAIRACSPKYAPFIHSVYLDKKKMAKYITRARGRASKKTKHTARDRVLRRIRFIDGCFTWRLYIPPRTYNNGMVSAAAAASVLHTCNIADARIANLSHVWRGGKRFKNLRSSKCAWRRNWDQVCVDFVPVRAVPSRVMDWYFVSRARVVGKQSTLMVYSIF